MRRPPTVSSFGLRDVDTVPIDVGRIGRICFYTRRENVIELVQPLTVRFSTTSEELTRLVPVLSTVGGEEAVMILLVGLEIG